jgi:hypothetical protein
MVPFWDQQPDFAVQHPTLRYAETLPPNALLAMDQFGV